MDRFLSHYILRVDAKGRISVPAPFRAVLARDGFPGIYCYPSLDQPSVDMGGNALLAEIENLMDRYPPFSEERENLATALYGVSETLKMDREGRVLLSDTLKDHAGIIETAAFVGLGYKFQIWAPDRFGAQLSEATGKMRMLKTQLSTLDAAAKHGARER